MPKNEDSFILDNNDQCKNFIAPISNNMYEYMESRPNSKFVVFYKYLTHSDLATFGKATKPNSHQNNFLYYIGTDEMLDVETKTGKPFQTAHQSCIGLKKELYKIVGLPDPREVPPYLINDFMDVKLVNDNLEYFSSKYTEEIFKKLNKNIDSKKSKSWDFQNLDIHVDSGLFTKIQLHIAVHGLGMEKDDEFHNLRHHMFKGDTFILLFELNGLEKTMFILLEKNPAFFSLLGLYNKSYELYQKKLRERLIAKTTNKQNALDIEKVDDEVTRQQQSAWRKMLANEMMGYTQVTNQVFCPFTYITANFEELGSLFVASHIKGFSDPNTKNEEKYDINNGLLLCANADALFDKHLITIDENKDLVFSYLLDNDIKLKNQLLLLQPIFKPILNEKRMKYLSYHRMVFNELEKSRKTS